MELIDKRLQFHKFLKKKKLLSNFYRHDESGLVVAIKRDLKKFQFSEKIFLISKFTQKWFSVYGKRV